jgi:hypothetical protein
MQYQIRATESGENAQQKPGAFDVRTKAGDRSKYPHPGDRYSCA